MMFHVPFSVCFFAFYEAGPGDGFCGVNQGFERPGDGLFRFGAGELAAVAEELPEGRAVDGDEDGDDACLLPVGETFEEGGETLGEGGAAFDASAFADFGAGGGVEDGADEGLVGVELAEDSLR